MADLEAVLADVSYLMAMEKSKCTPAARYLDCSIVDCKIDEARRRTCLIERMIDL